jgi:probable HAF family extracellular repeat protein
MRQAFHTAVATGLALAAGAAMAQAPRYRVVDVFDPPPYPGPFRGTSATIGNGPWSAATFEQIGGGFAAFRCTRHGCDMVALAEHPGGGRHASDVNRYGAMVGRTDGERNSSGFVTDNEGNVRATIPSLNQDCGWQLLDSSAIALNDHGLVVGLSQTCDRVMHGVLFEHEVLTRIPLAPGVAEVTPQDVNNHRLVVGGALRTDGGGEAFSYDGQAMRLLGTLGGTWSHAYAVNNLDQIVGCSETAGNASRQAFLYQQGAMSVLPSPGDGNACAYGINKQGDVVGMATVSGQGMGFLYQGGASHLLQDVLRPADRDAWHLLEPIDASP